MLRKGKYGLAWGSRSNPSLPLLAELERIDQDALIAPCLNPLPSLSDAKNDCNVALGEGEVLGLKLLPFALSEVYV